MSAPVRKSWQDIRITGASRVEEEASKAPATTRVITEEQIQMRAYRSLAQLLKDIPEMHIHDWVAEESGTAASVRGIYGSNFFVILMDGVRVSSPTNEYVMLVENIPIQVVKQVEIIFGASSALYGADALSGVINIITKNPKEKRELALTFQGGLNSLYNGTLYFGQRIGENLILNVAGSYHKERNEDIFQRFTFDLTPYQSGTFKTIFGEMSPKAPYRKEIEMLHKSYAFQVNLKSREFEAMFVRNYTQNPTSFPCSPNNAIYNDEQFFGHNTTVGSISFAKRFGKISAKSLLSGNIYELSPESNFRNVYTGMEYGYKYAYGSQLKAEEQIYWNIGKNTLISGGFTYEKFTAVPKTCDMPKPIDLSKNLASRYIGTDIPMNFFVLNYQNVGAFLQARVAIKEKLYITLGSRWDKNSRFEAAFNPRLGMVFSPTQKLIFKLLYGKSFMAPSPLSTYENYGSFYSDNGGKTYKSYFFHLPNPNLQPIYMQNFEYSAKYSPTENFSIQLNSYLIFLNNLYAFANDKETLNLYNGKFMGAEVDYISIKINSGEQKNYGGTLQMDYFREFGEGKLQAYFALTYTDGRTSNDAPISMTSPFIFRTGFDWQYKKISFSPRLVAVGEQISDYKIADSNEQMRMKGYQLLNFSFRWNFYKKSFVTLNVQNALNQLYSQVGWFNPEDKDGESAYRLLNGIREPFRFQLGVQLSVF